MIKEDLFGAKAEKSVIEPNFLDQKAIHKQAKQNNILQARFTRVFGEPVSRPIPGSTFVDKARQATRLIQQVMHWYFAGAARNLYSELHDPKIQNSKFFPGLFD
jgi:hypothetical protein